MKQLNKIVDSFIYFVMGVSGIVLFIVTFLQVVFRYVLKSPLPWSTDIIRLSFAYLVFFGAACCVRDKGHLNIDVLLTSIPKKLSRTVEILINLVLVAFFVVLTKLGIDFSATGLGQTTSYLPLPMTVYYISIPISGVLMIYYMVQHIVQQIKTFHQPQQRQEETT